MTRRQQFLKQRARNIRRREHARSVNSVWGRDPVTGKTIRKAYRVVWTADGVMSGHRTSGKTWTYLEGLPPGMPVPGVTLITGGGSTPPHAHILPPAKRPNVVYSSNFDFPVVGLHRRRVQLWHRKPNRFTKEQRILYIANLKAWRNGFFELDDPLGRHPTGADVDNGAPFLSEFPYVW